MSIRPIAGEAQAPDFLRLHEVLREEINTYTHLTGITFENEREAVITVCIDCAIFDYCFMDSLVHKLRLSDPIEVIALRASIREELILLYADIPERLRIEGILVEKGVL